MKRWLSSSKPDVLFLIGEFGDGKTYQSYLLGRRLHEQFLEDPDSGVITDSGYPKKATRAFTQFGLEDEVDLRYEWAGIPSGAPCSFSGEQGG
ncbi:MAG: hypothetical protein GY835_24900 [bacterium]|nr:hypothetical protein [bacterium]